jgi:methylmalonyl-CoA mutase C-terminal domain/subunit
MFMVYVSRLGGLIFVTRAKSTAPTDDLGPDMIHHGGADDGLLVGRRPGSLGASSAMSEERAVTGPQTIRVLLAKVGLDGHDRGIKVVARALRDAGMEVVYTGLHRSPDEIVATAIQEDVDVIGISLLSGAHMTLFPAVLALLREHGVLERFIIVGGGVMPDEDVAALKMLGVQEILGQDTPPEYIAARIAELVAQRGVRL